MTAPACGMLRGMVRRLPVLQSPGAEPELSFGAARLVGATFSLLVWMPLLWLALRFGGVGVGVSFALACGGGGAVCAARIRTARLKNAAFSGLLAAAVVSAVALLGSPNGTGFGAYIGAALLLPLGSAAAYFGAGLWLRLRRPHGAATTPGGSQRKSL